MAFYPKIDNNQLLQFKIVIENMMKDADYLKSPECPYGQEIIAYLLALRPPEVTDLFAGEGVDEMMMVDDQVKSIINDLEAMNALMAKADTKEKIDYYKAKTAMYDKLIGMRERANSIKAMNDFRNTILQFMDEELTKDQITAIMKRLDDAS
jgi:hypothetical protein